MSAVPAHADPGALPTDAEGFHFLAGKWKVHHLKLKEPLTGREEWQQFEGMARFQTLIDGLVSVEELSDGQGRPYGGAIRSFDRTTRRWSDRWIPAGTGTLQDPVEGVFENGVGSFIASDVWDDKPILSRGIWRRISADEVTWEQAASLDNGKTWETNWKMRFERVKAP